MAARQRIIPVRREYNRWVANQTLEDYALRFTAKSARRFSSARISQTAIAPSPSWRWKPSAVPYHVLRHDQRHRRDPRREPMILLVGLPISRMPFVTASTSTFSRAARASAISARRSPR